MTIEELRVLITAKTDGLQKGLNHAKSQMVSLEKNVKSSSDKVSKAFSGIGKALKAAGIIVAVKEITTKIAGLTKEAMSVDAQMENLSRTMGASKSAFMAWARNNAAAFGVSESAAVKYGNTFSNLISGFIADTSKSTAYTKQLIEASAVIASRTGRTVEDVNERIRSGLLGSTEAIEDLGINVNVALLETTDAFKQLANGRSWAKLTFQEQQQVRLFAIMEQSAKKFGAELAGGGATSLMMFRAQLENLKLELGRAFAPLAETVIPALTQFVKWIADAVRWTNAFFAALRGQSQAMGGVAQATQQAAQAQGDLAKQTEKAGKAAKGALAGFDELNILATGDTDAGSSTAAETPFIPASGGDVAAPDMDTSKIEAAAKRIKDAFEKTIKKIGQDFAPSISAWGKAFEGLKEPAAQAWEKIKESAKGCWENTLAPLCGYVTGEFVPNIANSFSETFAPIFGDVMPVLFDEFAKDFGFACSEFDRISNDVLIPAMAGIEKASEDAFGGVKTSWDKHGAGILEGFQGFKESLRGIWDSLYTNVFQPVFEKIGGTVSWLWDNHIKPFWDNIAGFIGSLTEFLLVFWNTVLSPIVNYIVKEVGRQINWVVGSISDIIGTFIGFFTDVVGGILKTLGGLLDFLTGIFTGDWDKAWNGLKTACEGVWDTIWGHIKGTINLIIDGLNTLWRAVYHVVSGFVNGIGGIAGALGSLLGQDWKFSMPKEPPLIPKLADGGLAYGPTLAMIGEGRDREAVLPLNNSVYAEIAQGINANSQGDPMVVTLLQSLLDAVNRIDPNIVLDGVKLAQASGGYFDAEQRRRGASVIKVV